MSIHKTLAFDIGVGDTKCFVTVLKAKQLFKISSVSRANEDPESGYQRLLNIKRAKDIAGYLNDGNIIPGSIILSAQNGCAIKYNDKSHELEIDVTKGNLFVIDGQHRLYGASLAEQDVSLPVCIFTELDLQQEVQYFLDVNSNQKGVPKTLRIELLKFLSEPESKDAIRNKLLKELGEDLSSPLYGRISTTASVPGKLSHVPFKAALDPLLEGDVLSNFNYDQKKTLLLNYLTAVEKVLENIDGGANKISNAAFFQAIFRVFEKACNMALTFNKSYSIDSFYNVMDGLARLDLENNNGTNQQAITNLASEMSKLLDIHSKTLGVPGDLLL
jgi:DNA sulfur modification protein DndB